MTNTSSHETIGTKLTLETVISRLKIIAFVSDQKRRDLISACVTTAKMHKAPPSMIEARAPVLRDIFLKTKPAMAGLTLKRQQNVRSTVLAACVLTGAIPGIPDHSTQLEEWIRFSRQAKQKHHAHTVARFARWCSDRAVTPQQVTADTLADFQDFIDERVLTKSPHLITKQTRLAFNAICKISALATPIPTPPARQYVSDRITSYSPQLQQEFTSYIESLNHEDPYASHGAAMTLKPLSVRNTKQHLLRFLHAAVEGGIPRDQLNSLEALVDDTTWRTAFEVIGNRIGTTYPATLSLIARSLLTMARVRLELPAHRLKSLIQAEHKISGENGLSQRNMGQRSKQRLAQFDTPENITKLIKLPARLLANAPLQRREYDGAVDVMVAAAISVLLSVPVRANNLSNLVLGTEVTLLPGPKSEPEYQVSIAAGKTKNNLGINGVIRGQHAIMLRTWIEKYRPLISKNDLGYLFPTPTGGPRDSGKFGRHIAERIDKHTGISMTPHMFRHFAAKIMLLANPAAVYQVQQVLNHKKVETTAAFYCDPNKQQSFDAYQEALQSKNFRKGLK